MLVLMTILSEVCVMMMFVRAAGYAHYGTPPHAANAPPASRASTHRLPYLCTRCATFPRFPLTPQRLLPAAVAHERHHTLRLAFPACNTTTFSRHAERSASLPSLQSQRRSWRNGDRAPLPPTINRGTAFPATAILAFCNNSGSM